MMKLPGGLWNAGKLSRGFGFKPLTGAVELAVAEASLDAAASLPEIVTRVLTAALKHLHPHAATAALIDRLSVGDRQFLMQQLSGWLGMDAVWMTAACTRCKAPFDFSIRASELPVKPSGDGYPFATVATSNGTATWRVPNGADQKAMATIPPEQTAERVLMERCLLEIKDPDAGPAAAWIAALDPDDMRKVEAALEDVAPEVTSALQVHCPVCHEANTVGVDPYLVLNGWSEAISTDVHTIASTYHWSEAEILSLSRNRRRRYLQLIDQARGMSN
ncbi:MAG: hypothetical protein QNI97_02325 [Desulfobacterales bacterium]|nr:hypothetical protein [Desulfobacterales bacterium]